MDNSLFEEIRKKNNIVDVISSYITLDKRGKNYFGVCPFHDDTNPSMSVSENKQIYKCFSCGASGNVFNFVMEYEHITFKEAVKNLADRVGISTGNIKINNTSKFDKYYKMYDLAEKLYQNNLNSSYGKGAKEYLNKRDISPELIKKFKIGLSPSTNDTLTKVLVSNNYNYDEIEKYGLGNGKNDLFINRIMFPLFNASGDTVGFSGRIYNSSSESKYINTKETPIFKKGELLYNYYNAKESIRLEKWVILVEGFMDVIRLYSADFKNVVASMGTALTKEQRILIKRLSNNLCLCFDGDSAGQHAIMKNGEELEKEGFNLSVIVLPENLDPDEYIIKYGKDSYKSLFDSRISFSDFKINYMKKDVNFSSLEEKTNYVNSVLKEISDIKDDIKKELLLKKLEIEFGINIEVLKNKLQNFDNCSKIDALQKKEIPAPVGKINKYQKATYIILNFMMNNYDACKIYEKKLNYLPEKIARYLANEIICFYKGSETFEIADFLTSLSNKPDLSNYLNKALNFELESYDTKMLYDYINVIKVYNSNQEIKRLKELMINEINPLRKAEISEKIRLLKLRSGEND